MKLGNTAADFHVRADLFNFWEWHLSLIFVVNAEHVVFVVLYPFKRVRWCDNNYSRPSGRPVYKLRNEINGWFSRLVHLYDQNSKSDEIPNYYK